MKIKKILAFAVMMMLSFAIVKSDAQAASQPYLFADEMEQDACRGEVANIVYSYFPAYKNEEISVKIYNESGEVCGSAERSFYNTSTGKISYTVTWDTEDYKEGRYEVIATMRYYTLGAWREKASKSTSWINLKEHSYSVEPSKKATMSESGKSKYTCSNCGNSYTNTVPKIASVELSKKAYTYDGNRKGPAVVVKDSKGKKLKKGTDYTIQYSDGRVKVGTHSVRVTFKGAYDGKKTVYFKINPVKTTLKTSDKGKSYVTVKWTKKSNITGYEIKLGTNSSVTKNTKTVKVTKSGTTSKKITGLKASTKYYVKIRTYKKVDGKPYYSEWSSPKSVTTQSNYKLRTTKKTLLSGSTFTQKLYTKSGKTVSASKVKFSSSNSKVASVNSKGVVTAKKPGTATISAKYNGSTVQATFTVKSRLTFNTKDVTFKPDGSKTVKMSFNGSCENIWYDIEDTDIVSCKWNNWNGNDVSLKLTGKDVGTTRVKIYYEGKGGSYDYHYINVNVEPNFTVKFKQKFPLKVTTYSYNGIAQAKGTIEDVDIVYYDNRVDLNIKGVLNSNDDSEELIFSYQVLDSDGYVVDSSYVFTDIETAGQKFKTTESIYFWDEKGKFTVVFDDYN